MRKVFLFILFLLMMACIFLVDTDVISIIPERPRVTVSPDYYEYKAHQVEDTVHIIVPRAGEG